MISALQPIWFAGQLTHRHPHLDATGKSIIRRHHTNHGVVLAVQSERLIDDVSLTTKAALPKSIAKHDHRRAAWLVFFVCEDTPDSGVGPQSRKQIGGHLPRQDALGFTIAGEVVTGAVIDADFFENVVLIAPVGEVRIRDRHLVQHRTTLVQKQQLLRVIVRQRPQHDRIDYAENCCVRANAQRQRQYHHERQRRSLNQHSHAITHVLKNGIHGFFLLSVSTGSGSAA